METKTILAKNMEKETSNALFLFQRDGYFEYVVATLNATDLDKNVGETVNNWNWGHYFSIDRFQDAANFLYENIKEKVKDFTIINFKIGDMDDFGNIFENRIKIFKKLSREDIIDIECSIKEFMENEEGWQYEDLYKSVLGELGVKWEYIGYDFEITI